MRRTLTLSSTAVLLALAGCSSTSPSSSPSNDGAVSTTATTTATTAAAPAESATISVTVSSTAVAIAGDATARTAMAQLTAKIHTATLTGIITEDNDSNDLIGRPHQYTSKVTFKDSRVPSSDTEGLDKGDVELGGSIEVFSTPQDAAARAKYIQTVTASIPALTEYDYVHGDVLVRVSRFLKPSQAKIYNQAVAGIN